MSDPHAEVVEVFLEEPLAARVDRFRRRSSYESRAEVVAAAVERLVEDR